MSLFKKLLFTSLLFSGAVAAASCSSGGTNPLGSGGKGAGGEGLMSGPGTTTGSNATSSAGTGTGGGSGGGGGGTTGCKTAADCDDSFSCTIDVCTDGVCSHSPGPNAGATACAAGSFCEVHTGCVPGAVCATTDQCVVKLGDDVCKTKITCDAATSICTYQLLDKDGDGHPPVVCAGDDCDDSDATKFPGHVEGCDNKDNDCDGTVDDGATCPGLGVCMNGACSCAPESTCDGACVDTTTDPTHCGNCATQCSARSTCQGGACTCPAGLTLCNGVCVDTKTDTANCGMCNKACTVCQAGGCVACAQADLFVLQDLSGSMDNVFDTSPSRWQAVQGALNTFLTDPLSGGMAVGIGYFPIVLGTTPACAVDPDCGLGGICFMGICIGGATGDSCVAADYATPIVPIALLPGNAAALKASIAAKAPNGSTPQAPALKGALSYAKAWAIAHPTHKVAVVMITDGLPNECTANVDLPTDTVNVAAMYAGDTPAVKTFVVGIGADVAPAVWSQIATAGGTGTAYVGATSTTIGPALTAVRTAFKTCP